MFKKYILQSVVCNIGFAKVVHSFISHFLYDICFQVVIPWCSPVGLRALFCVEPFMPDLELSQVNGTLFPRKSSLTSTLCSRLLALWRHISKSRTHFETKPDTGKVHCLLVLCLEMFYFLYECCHNSLLSSTHVNNRVIVTLCEWILMKFNTDNLYLNLKAEWHFQTIRNVDLN
jgi:hypothetical protein